MKKCGAIIVLIFVAVARDARPNCVNANTLANSVFDYSLCDVPDIDQRRAASADNMILGLPGDGAMYCVPTAAMNFFAFLADHPIAPIAEPGPQAQNWETSDPPIYNDMTMNLIVLGSHMGTDPVDGTGGDGGLTGMEQWLADNGVDEEYLVNLYYASGNYSPRLVDMAKSALAGRYVMPGVGWYTNADTNDPKTRAGGHLVSLVGASGNLTASMHTMVIHDPNNNSTKTTQASFFDKVIATQDVMSTFDGSVRTQTRMVGYGSGYLDGYFTIEFNWAFLVNRFRQFVAIDPFVHPSDPVTRFETVGPVVDVAIHPELTAHPYIAEGSNAIWQIDTLTGLSTRFANVGPPKALEFGGPDQTLFVLLKNHIVALDRDGKQMHRAFLRDDVDGIAWDARNHELLALSLRSSKLYRFSAALAALGDGSVIPVPGTGRPYMSVDPKTGIAWILRAGATAAVRAAGRESQLVPLEGVQSAESLAVGQNGFVYVSDGGHIVVFDPAGRLARSSPFNGLPGGPVLEFARPFSNFDPAIHSTPAWRNVLPPESTSER